MRNSNPFFLVLCGLLVIAPAASVLSGLILAPLFGAIVIAAIPLCLQQRKNLSWPSGLTIPTIIIALFLAWSLLSSQWAPNSHSALILWGKLAFLMLGEIIIIIVLSQYSVVIPGTMPVYAISIALALIVIERITHGTFIPLFYQLVSNKPFHYDIVDLNRSATIMALAIWPAVLALMQNGQKKAGWLLLCITFAVLVSLQSLSAVMGIAAGTSAFLLIYLLREKAINGLMASTIIGILLLPFIMYHINPPSVIAHFPHLPESSVHRLYIWQFASGKALLHWWNGWGLNASRYIPILPNDMLPQGKSPLPLHPHNNVIQLWLELGVPGVLLFAALVSTFFTIVKQHAATIHYKAASIACLIAYIVVGLTAFGIWQEWWVSAGLMALLGLALVGARGTRGENKKTIT